MPKLTPELEKELITKAMPKPGEFVEFVGWNCHDLDEPYDACRGWDGIERRCDCGNRRVSWVIDDDAEYAYGEAY